MLKGQFRPLSLERLIRCLVALGQSVTIEVKPPSGRNTPRRDRALVRNWRKQGMPIEPLAIAEGQWYATADGEVRKVVKIGVNDVTYVLRTSSSGREQPREGEETVVSVVTFAADVDRVVDCD